MNRRQRDRTADEVVASFTHRPGLQFSATWLATRERLDRAARDRALCRALANALPRQPRLLDLGSGTGSLFRFLAPIIGRSQTWIFADFDEDLMAEAQKRIVGWASRRGFGARVNAGSQSAGISLFTPHGVWRVTTQLTDLKGMPRGLPFDSVDAVVCSGLLDLTSRRWMERLVDGLRTPFYASMTVDGRDEWLPHHAADLAVRTAFRRDQRRDKGLGPGPALGIDAVKCLLSLLDRRRFEIAIAASDWLIPANRSSLAGRFAQMTAEAARQAMPRQASKITEWNAARLRQAKAARLVVRIGHRDILAFPP